MNIVDFNHAKELLDQKIFYFKHNDDDLLNRVNFIINSVRDEGDKALVSFTKEFDKVDLIPQKIPFNLNQVSSKNIHPKFVSALEQAIENITAFHRLQIPSNLSYQGKYGEKLSQQFTPIENVGVYVPGGKGGLTPLVSSFLMNVIPAQLAGVKEITVISPPNQGLGLDDHLVFAIKKLGIEKVFLSGGAQAIAALAYGTQTISPVDIIVGPGNQYVNLAKKLVFGEVMIDGLYGHSEIVIISDGSSSPRWVAADLLSQAEHAGGELVVLITNNRKHAEEVNREVEKLMSQLARKDLIESSLDKRGLIVVVEDLKVTPEIVNHIAPEHLELLVEDYEKLLPQIKHVGAIFIGEFASEPIGDYICGTNHILPTNRSARFSSPLGVYTFLKRTNLIEYNQEAFDAYAPAAMVLAEIENLTAHQKALEVRKISNN